MSWPRVSAFDVIFDAITPGEVEMTGQGRVRAGLDQGRARAWLAG